MNFSRNFKHKSKKIIISNKKSIPLLGKIKFFHKKISYNKISSTIWNKRLLNFRKKKENIWLRNGKNFNLLKIFYLKKENQKAKIQLIEIPFPNLINLIRKPIYWKKFKMEFSELAP